MNLTNKKILIVGLGMIGSSYACKLKGKGLYVGGISARQSTIDYALKRGYIDSGYASVEKEYVQKFDIVIFAVYPKLFVEWIKEHQDCFRSGAIVTDVTGVKQSIISQIKKVLRKDVEFIASHPMAGRELSGVENCNPGVFVGANYLIVPTEENTSEAIEISAEIGWLLEFGKISVISPEQHDEMIAFLSQLTHCIAVSLMCCKESEQLVDFTGDSFRDLTRIANINENMWSELFLMNTTELLAQMKLFESQFKKLKKALENDDVDTMKEMMRMSTQRRQYFNRK